MADPIKVWPNDAQQLFEMKQDLASVNAAGVESDGQLAFFVGKPTTGNQWTLKKITPNELGKLVYDYLTSSNIASQLASVLGDILGKVGGNSGQLTAGHDQDYIDSLPAFGFYSYSGNLVLPGRYGFLICLPSGGVYSKAQIIASGATTPNFQVRTYNRDSKLWGVWTG